NFDNFSGTSRSVHYKISSEFFLKLYEKNLLVKKNINQLYCPKEKKFLPDRYVEGTCPKCNASGARGDQCEACGSQLDPTELIRPYCKICNTTPILKETFHWFLKLAEFQKKLEQWQGNHKDWKDNVYNYCQGWFKEGLGDRPITRDIEWGVPVPLEEAKGKVIYVWFEAPIGYISSTIEWAEKKGEPELWKSYWKNPDCELIHFIGKDNIVFHAITWPATLMAQDGFILPRHIPANEFLNIEGQKLSTSRNRAVWVHEYLENFPSDSLRYYLATIAPEAKDADFSWSEFMLKHNSELADIYGNFVNRNFTFAHRYFGSSVPPLRNPSQTDYSMLNAMEKASKEMADYLDRFQLRLAAKVLMDVARDGNKYFNDKEPWKTRQTDI
ncbi:MAG: methionine--tRNA ligase, partial [Elusimicrobiota bacterium]